MSLCASHKVKNQKKIFWDHQIVFSAGTSESPNLNLMAAILRIFLSSSFSNFNPNLFPLFHSLWCCPVEFLIMVGKMKICQTWPMLETLDSYNCSIDWLSSSCPVLTKYRHSETVDYNPWVKRPKLRQFLTWKAGGSRQVGQKPPKKVKWDKAESFQPRFWSSIMFSPVILFTCQRVISDLKKGFFLGNFLTVLPK